MIKNTIIIYDFETSDRDPETCHPLQLAALAVDASHHQMPIMDGGEFNVFMRPDLTDDQIMDPSIIKDEALFRNGIKREDILKFPREKHSWNKFVQFCDYHAKDRVMIPCGHNIKDFDEIIINRLRDKYKSKKIFHEISYIDLLQEMWMWLEGVPEVTSYSLDFLRGYMGLNNSKYGDAHNALRDCYDCYEITKRILQWRRQLIYKKEKDGSRICRFKDCFA